MRSCVPLPGNLSTESAREGPGSVGIHLADLLPILIPFRGTADRRGHG